MIKTGIKHTDIMFLDIETVPIAKSIYDMPLVDVAIAWDAIHASRYNEEKVTDKDGVRPMTNNESFLKYAALYPEFGQIICISLGGFISETDFYVQAYYANPDERSLLQTVSNQLTKSSATKKFICGHNIKGFDLPFMIRRSVVTHSPLNTNFELYGKKPWEIVTFLDTKEMWNAGAFNLGSCSLQSICAVLGLDNPKEDMTGSDVMAAYQNGFPQKIGKYCNGDVIQTAFAYCMMTRGNVDGLQVVGNKF